MRTIIIGLGNPLLTDDALGIKAAAILRQELIDHDNIEVVEAYLGGLGLMELMIGFDRAIVVDAMTTGVHPPGTLVVEAPVGMDFKVKAVRLHLDNSHRTGIDTVQLVPTKGDDKWPVHYQWPVRAELIDR